MLPIQLCNIEYLWAHACRITVNTDPQFTSTDGRGANDRWTRSGYFFAKAIGTRSFLPIQYPCAMHFDRYPPHSLSSAFSIRRCFFSLCLFFSFFFFALLSSYPFLLTTSLFYPALFFLSSYRFYALQLCNVYRIDNRSVRMAWIFQRFPRLVKRK